MEIIYEDSQIIICYKESGLPVQTRNYREKDLVSILKLHLWAPGGSGPEPYIGVIHRLDQPVEGVMVFAKTRWAAKELSAQVKDGRMKKIYRAVVRKTGRGISPEGFLEDYLLDDKRGNTSQIVREGTKRAKLARLSYRVLEEREETALVEICLLTGRHHQIRVQLSHAGMPLAGDHKYGLPGEEGQLALCSVNLTLVHPVVREEINFTCEPQGAYFQGFAQHAK